SRFFLAHIFTGPAAAILLCAVAPFYLSLESGGVSPKLVLLSGLFLCFQSWGNMAESILLIKKKSRALAVFGLATGILFLIILAVFYGFRPDITLIFVLLISFNALKSGFSFSLVSLHWKAALTRKVLPFIKGAFPFIFISLAGYGMEMLDGFLVIHFFEDSTFPLYKYGARELPLSALLMSSLSVAMIPFLHRVNALAELKKRATRYMHVLFPLTILLIWTSSFLFTVIYGSGFTISAHIFNVYLLILGSRLLMPHSVLLSKGKEKTVLLSGIIELGVNLVLSLLFYHFWGLVGLVMATVAA